jgi:ribosomal-protein-serine acetyltransferase
MMFSIRLGDDGAELRPLQPWQAEEFLAHMDRGREFIGQHIALPDSVTNLESSRSFLQQYAAKAAADTGRIYGTWVAGKLVGGVLFRTMDVERCNAEAGCWLEPSAVARRLGMTKEGVLRDYYPHRGQRHDVEIWSVLAPEWRAGKQKS